MNQLRSFFFFFKFSAQPYQFSPSCLIGINKICDHRSRSSITVLDSQRAIQMMKQSCPSVCFLQVLSCCRNNLDISAHSLLPSSFYDSPAVKLYIPLSNLPQKKIIISSHNMSHSFLLIITILIKSSSPLYLPLAVTPPLLLILCRAQMKCLYITLPRCA